MLQIKSLFLLMNNKDQLLWRILFLKKDIYLLKKKKSLRKHRYKETKSSDYEYYDEDSNTYSTIDDVLDGEEKYRKILGIEQEINKKVIQKAYKQKMKEYHPDKISNMAEELQELALKRTKEINEAHEYFKKKYED